MGQAILSYPGMMPKTEWKVDIGEAELFIGPDFERPMFFCSPRSAFQMMEKNLPTNITFRTYAGEYYQFKLDRFHGHQGMLLTSTLKDTFFFFSKSLKTVHNIDGTMAIARKGQETYSSKTAYSGYVCWGGYFENRYTRLLQNMASQKIYLTDETLNEIYVELKRRNKCQDSE